MAKRRAKAATTDAPAVVPEPQLMSREQLLAYRADLMGKQQAIAVRIKTIQAEAGECVGKLNQLAGELSAVTRMLGGAAA